jgi:hypothetical protein
LTRIGLGLLGFVALAALVSQLNLQHDMHRLDAGMLSGPQEGNYFITVDELSRSAAKEKGRLRNVPSEGTGDNVARLLAAKKSCEVSFALAQDGSDWGKAGDLELIGRLAKSESVFVLGKDADAITDVTRIAHMKIGIGPKQSGSAHLAAQLFALPELASLQVDLQNYQNPEALERVKDGRLDLMLVVMDEDAPWLVQTMREGIVQMAGFSRLDVLVRRLPHMRSGRIGAGQFDPLRVLPKEDKRVLRVETLVVSNGCAGRSTTIDLMTILARRFPDFVRHNKETPNSTGLELASGARGFFEHDGPELADEYAPWFVDVMPPTNWAYVVMGVSLLFNAMSMAHRFRLWRIDAARVSLEAEIAALFGPTATLGDIARAGPEEEAKARTERDHIEHLVRELEALAARSRRQSLSMLVPMGQEMGYRYQEGVIHETLSVLHDLLRRTGQ